MKDFNEVKAILAEIEHFLHHWIHPFKAAIQILPKSRFHEMICFRATLLDMSSEDFERLVSYNLEDLNRCYDRSRKSLRKEEKSRNKINKQSMMEDLHAEIVRLVLSRLLIFVSRRSGQRCDGFRRLLCEILSHTLSHCRLTRPSIMTARRVELELEKGNFSLSQSVAADELNRVSVQAWNKHISKYPELHEKLYSEEQIRDDEEEEAEEEKEKAIPTKDSSDSPLDPPSYTPHPTPAPSSSPLPTPAAFRPIGRSLNDVGI